MSTCFDCAMPLNVPPIGPGSRDAVLLCTSCLMRGCGTNAVSDAATPAPPAALSYLDLREWTCEVCSCTARVPHAGVTRPLPEGWRAVQAGVACVACATCSESIERVASVAIAAEVALIRAKAAGLRTALDAEEGEA